MTALRKNRVNHAYLFSGPRGCGKTTSARILARCLNCAEGPTDTPCGKCPSCVELARGGSGSLDVIEIDAASHGGVDDARDLRERATYAPVRDRYKIFIIDEAHMVTSAGFNALLKIVEEPPEHIKFIFATTEPDKVIGTIRSRTHHYPFRLVPPEPLMAYLELLCTQENVPVAPGVLSLVIRAGGGSVRDSLSVLDQLMAGAGPNGLDYELAVALLGYTHASLLDDVVEAVAASDAATVFRAVDRVIQTGHDPRRFVEDLLERFRDLIIVQAMPESAQSILRGMPADQIARMQNQAHNLGAAELSRAADVTNTALTEMTGATSPRLHLELLCARILLPSSEQTERGIAARIDRVERRLNYAGNDVGAPAAAPARSGARRPGRGCPGPGGSALQPLPFRRLRSQLRRPSAPAVAPERGAEPARETLTPPRVSTGDWPVDEPAAVNRAASGRAPAPQASAPAQPAPAPVAPPAPAPSSPAPAGPAPSAPAAPAAPAQNQPAPAAPAAAPAAASGAGSGPDVEVLRRAWPEILQTLTKIKRSTWALVEPNAQVGHFEDHVLTLAFTTSGLAGAFGRADHSENLRQAIHKTIGIECQINAVASGSNSAASSEPNPKAPVSRDVPATSTDADWGLPPAAAPAQASPGAHRATAVGACRAAAVGSGCSTAPVTPAAPAASASRRPGSRFSGRPAPGTRCPGAVPRSGDCCPRGNRRPRAGKRTARRVVPEAAGSYAYPDDDWGPPRDEDAPPLDEEPPMDWDPVRPCRGAGRPAGRRARDPPAKRRPLPARSARCVQAGPGRRLRPPRRRTPPTTRGPAPSSRPPGSGRSARTPTSGATRPEESVTPEPTPEPEPPHYEPAAAQVPHYAAAVSASAAYEPVELLVERLGRLRGVGAGRRRSRFSLSKRHAMAAPAAPAAAFDDRGPRISGCANPGGPAKPLPAAVQQPGSRSRTRQGSGPRRGRHHHVCPGHPQRGRRNDRGIGRLRTGRRRTHPGRKTG